MMEPGHLLILQNLGNSLEASQMNALAICYDDLAFHCIRVADIASLVSNILDSLINKEKKAFLE